MKCVVCDKPIWPWQKWTTKTLIDTRRGESHVPQKVVLHVACQRR